jgi:hypothetical protein
MKHFFSPPPEIGWRAEVSPADHPVSQYEFDVLIGADGKRNTLDGEFLFKFPQHYMRSVNIKILKLNLMKLLPAVLLSDLDVLHLH